MAAASNWLALATLAAKLVATGTGLLIDVGSTTTDLIPFRDGLVAASGWTDTERLGTGALVYAGVKRTPVCALAASLPFRGLATGLCAELFATTLDVYLTLGSLREHPDDLDTADGRPATAEGARDRLARMVGADREGFTADDAKALARAADEALLLRLVESADRACRTLGGRPGTVVVSGSGEFLARRVGTRVVRPGGQTVELGSFWGAEGSTAACARALIELYFRHENLTRARL
jgi:probable H4MPT-linked C1 transfer pathway protein